MSDNDDRVLGWDDEISNDSTGQSTILAPGIYPFEIVNLKRGQHQPKASGKLPACPKAEVTVRVYAPDGEKVDINNNLFLHSRCEGMLCAFFLSIGHRKHGESLRPNWNRVIGSRGFCKVDVREYSKDDGTKGKSNEIKSFLDPEKAPKAGQTPQPPSDPPPFDVPGEGGF
ncbi:MAG: DUF669 domain-containing protein [Betaproteobacteria bacterium]|nr:DUF669 domain-containing protein [Betaproteobacteria bacterium]